MHVPCSMPLAEPWSPVGYQVVQLPEVDVVSGKPSEVKLAPASPTAKSALPGSPVGYRVVLVGEDRLPAAPSRPSESRDGTSRAHRNARRPPQRHRPKSNGMAIWLPLVVVAAVGLPISLATAIAASQRRAALAPVVALPEQGVVFVALAENQQEPQPGDVAAGDAAVAVPRVLALEAERADECAECAGPDAANNAGGDHEFFGTAVRFVRNPVEAARIASAQRKLTFVLHVSGNFDDPGFTWNNAEALRRGALVQPDVGAYLNRHYVAAFQKIATFQKIGNAKVGGNVASYFCTPDGLVLHAVTGPVSSRVLLSEARWANETYEMARLENKTTPAELRACFRRAHVARLQNEHRLRNLTVEQLPDNVVLTPESIALLFDQNRHMTDAGKVHLLLAVAPLPPIEQVYQAVFERLLNERISTNPVATR